MPKITFTIETKHSEHLSLIEIIELELFKLRFYAATHSGKLSKTQDARFHELIKARRVYNNNKINHNGD